MGHEQRGIRVRRASGGPATGAAQVGAMAGIYAKLRIHLVWSTRGRRPWLDREWHGRLFARSDVLAASLGARLVSAGAGRDHLHLYVELPAALALAPLVDTPQGGVRPAGSGAPSRIDGSSAGRRDTRPSASRPTTMPACWTICAIRRCVIASGTSPGVLALLELHGVSVHAPGGSELTRAPGQRVTSCLRSRVSRRRTDPSYTRSPTRTTAPPRICGVGAEAGDHLLAERPAQRRLDRSLEPLVRRARQRHAGPKPVELHVEQRGILGGDISAATGPARASLPLAGRARTPGARP